jgi:hypothetical protein
MTPKNRSQYQATPFKDSVRLVAAGTFTLILIVVIFGYISRWPSPWHYGQGLLVSGPIAWLIGFVVWVARYIAMTDRIYIYARTVGPDSPKEREDVDRHDTAVVRAVFWSMFLVGLSTMTIGIIIMMLFPPMALR